MVTRAVKSDAEQHQSGGYSPTQWTDGVNVSVAHGGESGDCPPECVGEAVDQRAFYSDFGLVEQFGSQTMTSMPGIKVVYIVPARGVWKRCLMMRPKEPIRLMMVIKRKIRIHLLHSTYGSMKKGMQLRKSIYPQRMNASLFGLRTRRMQKGVP